MTPKEENRPFGVEPIPAGKLLHPDATGYVCAGSIAQCPLGKAIAIALPKFRIAIFHLAEGFFAVKDACPHAEYPLSKGVVEGDMITCASHGWQFCVPTGACLRGAPDLCIRTFPVEIHAEQLWVKVRT